MSVFPIKYKKKSSTSNRKVTITKWRVQIRKKQHRIDQVFNEEKSARAFEIKELIRINSGHSFLNTEPLLQGKAYPTMRDLLFNYHNISKQYLAQSTVNADRNRCLSVIPNTSISVKQCGNKINNYEIGFSLLKKKNKPSNFSLGDVKIHTVDFWILIFFIENRRKEGLKPNTILREISIISAAFEKVYKLYPDQFPNGLQNPVKLIPRGEKPRQENIRTRTLSNDESNNLSLFLKSKKNKEPYYLYIICLLSGARKSEVLGISAKNIDFENWSVYLPKTKNNKPRSILIPNNAELRNWLNLFKNSEEKIFKLTQSNFRHYWVAALNSVNLYKINERPFFHDTRRTALTQLIRGSQLNTFEIAKNMGLSTKSVEKEKSVMPEMMQGIFAKLRTGERLSEYEIMKLAGHGTLAMTNHYYGDRN